MKKFPRGIEIAGSSIIENEKGEILLTKSPKWKNKYVMPGGHIEPGEKIADAQVREAKEEIGLNLKYIDMITFGELINSKDFHRSAHFIYFDILCRVKGRPKIKLDKKELTEYVWVTPQKALKMDLAESYDKTILEYLKYKNGKKK